jgi:hypothetical protein
MIGRSIGRSVAHSLSTPRIAAGGGGAPLLLDTYSGAAAAYSLRKLRTDYTGSAIRVRRASDSAEQDIGFTLAGELDVAALTAFCGAGDGFVAVWYDQQNSNNGVQVTATSQPKIFDSVTGIITENSKPAISFDGGDLLPCGQITTFTSQSIFAVVKSNSPGFDAFIEKADSANQNNRQIWLGVNATTPTYEFTFLSHGSSAAGGDGSVYSIVSGIMTASSQSYLYANGSLLADFTASFERSSNASVNLGGQYSRWVGLMQELILFDTVQNDARSGIESSQSSHYGITLS